MENIADWINNNYRTRYGFGYGYGDGDGYGGGSGSGSGPGYRSGGGDGFGYGSGYGYGSGGVDGSGDGGGSGYGDGSGSGYGDGCGSGSGYEYGSGNGSGDGSGYGKYNSDNVYNIDGVQTVIKTIHGATARGYIINNDLTTTPCFIVKSRGFFAHGATLREARVELDEKIFASKNVSERIELFLKEIDIAQKYTGQFYYDWHGKLTGSCEFGRDAFVKDNQIDLASSYTLAEFIDLTINSYGHEVIEKIKEKLRINYETIQTNSGRTIQNI